MHLVIVIAFYIGLFALAGLALNLLIFALVAIYEIPVSIYRKYKERQRQKALDKAKGEAIRAFVKMVHDNKVEEEAKQNSDIAYKSAVKKASVKKRKTTKK